MSENCDAMFKTYLISYDINSYSRRIYQLYNVIKSCSLDEKWVQCINNIWIIRANCDANIIYEKMKEVLDNNDCFIIVEITSNVEGWLDTKVWDYLSEEIFNKNIIASDA